MEDRKHQFNIEIAASPETVWDALTKPEDIVRWFTPEARVEPGAGGKLWLRWGDGSEGAHDILEWDPGKKLTLGWAGQRIMFEIAGHGGTAFLHMVHSGFSADSKFDDEFEATYGGWSTYLAVMQYVLPRKAAGPVDNISIVRQVDGRRDLVWPHVSDVWRILERPVVDLVNPAPRYAGGYTVVTVPQLNDSPVAVFCEGFGAKTFVTVAAYLVGPAREEAAAVRARITHFLDNLPPLAGHPASQPE